MSIPQEEREWIVRWWRNRDTELHTDRQFLIILHDLTQLPTTDICRVLELPCNTGRQSPKKPAGPKLYTNAQRREAVRLIRDEHLTQRMTADILDVPERAVRYWWQAYRENGVDSYSFEDPEEEKK